MKKSVSLFVMLLGLVTANAQEQINEIQKVETRFFRPSVTNVYFDSDNGVASKILDNLSDRKVEERFDDHTLNIASLKGNDIKPYLGELSRAIVAKWFNRDGKGNFDTKLVASRGNYTAVDADVLESNAAAVNRVEMLGEKLLSRSYLLVWSVPAAEEKTLEKGGKLYNAECSLQVYKLGWTKEVETNFYENYWSDSQNYNAANVAKWDTATFPMELVYEKTFKKSSSDSKFDPMKMLSDLKTKAMSSFSKEPSSVEPEEVDPIQPISDKLYSHAYYLLDKNLDDFKVKTSVYSQYPIKGKLGKKESLEEGQRFFIYELRQDDNGNQTKKRMAVARVKTAADNFKAANDGETNEDDFSVFQQQGGKHVYESMLLERKPELGFSVAAGYSFSPGNKGFSGLEPTLRYRYGLSNIFGVTGILNTGTLEKSDIKVTAISVFGFYEREFYFTNKGNFYVAPSLGVGMSLYTVATSNSGSSGQSKNPSIGSYALNLQVGAFYNLHPLVKLYAKLGAISTFGYTDTSKEVVLTQASKEYLKENEKGWGFDKIDGFGFSPTISAGVIVNF